MKKILIVDDHENNRVILKLLLEEFKKENPDINYEIDEAQDGLIAVDMASKKSYDLIFMDIMMPNLDGIEATAKIKAFDKHVMIIAVSAVDDSSRQKQILSNGAEDYISKPINADIFNSRVSNYFKLLSSRDKKAPKHEAHLHLFDDKVYSHNLTFYINDDDSLSEFWGYYLLYSSDRCEQLSNVVRTNFVLCELLLKMNTKTIIVVEESEEHKFFTLNNIEMLGEKLVKLVLYKNAGNLEYVMDSSKISFKINHTFLIEEIKPQNIQAQPLHVEPEANIEFSKSSDELHVYSYMDSDDLDNMEVYIQKLNSLMLIVGGGSIEESEVAEIAQLLDSIARVMNIYSETYALGQSIQLLSDTIHTNTDLFVENAAALGTMCIAFGKDLLKWKESIFESGAPSEDYFDATIITGAQTISSMLSPDSDSDTADDLDDIFDF